MEEQAATDGLYDDYEFVTREQLEQLRLTSLLGTNTLRPYMHGFFIDARLHAKAVSLSQPFAYEQWRKERVAAKIDAKTAGRIAPVTKQKVRVNAELADELQRKAGKAPILSATSVSPRSAPLPPAPCAGRWTTWKGPLRPNLCWTCGPIRAGPSLPG